MTLISFLEKAESFENLTLVFKKYFENVLEQNSRCEAEELFFKSYIDILHNYMNGGLMLFPLSLAVIRGPEKSRNWQEDLDIDETF